MPILKILQVLKNNFETRKQIFLNKHSLHHVLINYVSWHISRNSGCANDSEGINITRVLNVPIYGKGFLEWFTGTYP